MQTQRDHVHAHQFLVGRMASGLVLGDPSSAEVPARRAVFGMIIGLVIAVVGVVGFGLYGLLFPGGSKDWQVPGAILVEEESGTRFVYIGGELRPTLNMASAMLLQGGNGAHIEMINRASLSEVPRGRPIGIPGAPQVLPGPADMLAGPWLLCLPGSAAGPVTVSAATDGTGLPVGLNLDSGASARPLADGKVVLVRASSGAESLLWGNVRYPVADPSVLVALGMANVVPAPAPQRWLDALPKGVTIGAAPIDGAGSEGPKVGGRAYDVGQLFRQHAMNGAEQLFVLRADGLAPVNKMEFALLAAKAANTPPVEVDAAAVVSAPRSPDRSLTGQRIPDLTGVTWQDNGGQAICLRQQPAGQNPVSTVVLADRADSAIAGDGRAGIQVPPGKGMVVTKAPVPKNGIGAEQYLITDQGIKYPIAGEDAMKALGIGGSGGVPFAGELLAMVPTGPTLSMRAPGLT